MTIPILISIAAVKLLADDDPSECCWELSLQKMKVF